MLTNTDMLSYLPDMYYVRYADFKNIKNIDSILEKKDIVILYPINKLENCGHWTCIFLRPDNVIEFFDSYGKKLDDQLDWAPNFHEYELSKLLIKSKYPVEYFNYKLQGPTSTVCGDFCIARLKFKHISDEEFYNLFKKGKEFTSDELVHEWLIRQPINVIKGGAEINSDDNIYALLSQEAYEPKNNREKTVNTYNYDLDSSTERVAVYVSNSKKKIIIAFRGTVPSDKTDLLADTFITANQLEKSDSYQRSYQVVQGVIKKYPGYTIELTGHSKGGSFALGISKKLPLQDSKVVVFNPGFSPLGLATSIKENLKAKLNPNSEAAQRLRNQTIYTTGLDPISISSLLSSGVKIITPKSINIHSLSNF